MEISAELVKKLREETGISVMQCRKALEEAGGDIEKAKAILKSKSAEFASKKGGRTLGSGTIASYIHGAGGVGSMVELMCETDFVAKNEEFVKLARDIAMQVAATDPKYIKAEDAPAGESESVLLTQPFIKNPELTITNLIDEAVQKFGEKMEVSRFVRFAI